MSRNKKNIIFLEGPSGSGKTTLASYLFKYYRKNKIDVAMVPEFSTSPIGKLLNSPTFTTIGYPEYLMGINGALVYLSDKIYLLNKALNGNASTLIVDRYFVSQMILGALLMKDKSMKEVLIESIYKVHKLFLNNYSTNSYLVLLDGKTNDLINRIEKRENASINEEKRKFISESKGKYQEFDYSDFRMNTIYIDTTGKSIPITRDEIISNISFSNY